jgi:hypothetical protein
MRQLRVKRKQGALEVDTSERVVRLFTIEVALDQISGKWYHFMKPINRIKNSINIVIDLNFPATLWL